MPDWSLIVQFGAGLAKHLRRMDETYYALADAAVSCLPILGSQRARLHDAPFLDVRQQKVEKIPSAALEAIMIGSGKAGSLDR